MVIRSEVHYRWYIVNTFFRRDLGSNVEHTIRTSCRTSIIVVPGVAQDAVPAGLADAR
jgi:hypothetical protein